MTLEEVLSVARLGAAQGCTEALFTLGDFLQPLELPLQLSLRLRWPHLFQTWASSPKHVSGHHPVAVFRNSVGPPKPPHVAFAPARCMLSGHTNSTCWYASNPSDLYCIRNPLCLRQ